MNNSITSWRNVAAVSITGAWLLAVLFVARADAQGLVGAPPHKPMFSCEWMEAAHNTLTWWGYEYTYAPALAITRLLTFVATLIVLVVPLSDKKKGNLKLIALEFVGLACVPICVQMGGAFYYYNFVPLPGLPGFP